MIQVYGYPNSRSTRITWMLEELGIEYEFVLVDLANADNRSEPFLSINPAGKVPAIKDEGLTLTESAAILAYLGDKYPEKNLVPKSGTAQRALYDQWSYFALCELEQPLWTMGKHRFALPEEFRKPEIFSTAEWEFQKALALFSKGLDDKLYILGDTFTGADILLAQTLFWGMYFKQSIEQENLVAYAERQKVRSAYTQATAKEKVYLNK